MIKRGSCRQYFVLRAFIIALVTGVFAAVSGYPEPFSESLQINKLVINEIDYDQPGTDAAEFIEIKNVSGNTVSLESYAIVLVNGSNDSIYKTIDLPAVDLEDGEYYVICSNSGTTLNCDLDIEPDINLIQNGSPDAVAIMFGQTVVDTISYEGDVAAPYTEGSGAGLQDDPSVDSIGISRYPDGVDTDQNNLDMSMRCITPGEVNSDKTKDCGQLLGDMNGDDIIDISDVILILRIALKLDPVKPCSDLNNDSIVDISDVILTLRMALKLDPLQQCT